MLTLYNVISADGYIMTKDGDESFIPDSIWPTVLDVFRQYEIILMGGKTYEAFQNYGNKLLKPFEDLAIRKVVVSRDEGFKPKPGYEVVKDARDIISQNDRVLVSSGPGYNNYLFENNLIDVIVLHRLPVSLGEGIKPFEDTFMKNFVLISESPKGMVDELVYKKQ